MISGPTVCERVSLPAYQLNGVDGLLEHSRLQIRYSANMAAVVEGAPVTLSVKENTPIQL